MMRIAAVVLLLAIPTAAKLRQVPLSDLVTESDLVCTAHVVDIQFRTGGGSCRLVVDQILKGHSNTDTVSLQWDDKEDVPALPMSRGVLAFLSSTSEFSSTYHSFSGWPILGASEIRRPNCMAAVPFGSPMGHVTFDTTKVRFTDSLFVPLIDKFVKTRGICLDSFIAYIRTLASAERPASRAPWWRLGPGSGGVLYPPTEQ